MAATTTAANKSPQQQQHRRQQHLQWSACIMIVVFGLFSMLAGNCVNGVSGVVFFPIPKSEIRNPKEQNATKPTMPFQSFLWSAIMENSYFSMGLLWAWEMAYWIILPTLNWQLHWPRLFPFVRIVAVSTWATAAHKKVSSEIISYIHSE